MKLHHLSLLLLLLSACAPPREGLPAADLCSSIRTLDLPLASVVDGTWESSPMQEGYVAVAPGECVLFPIEPPLPAPPRLVQVYNAFPAADGGPPSFITPSPASGDAALLVEVAEDGIVLRNLTGGEWFYRVAAR